MKSASSLVIVIGGSRGLGNAALRQLALTLPAGSHFIFTGRNRNQLEDEARNLHSSYETHTFHPLPMEMDKVDAEKIKDAMKNAMKGGDVKQVLLLFSAFQLGFCGPVSNLNTSEVTNYFHCNVTRFNYNYFWFYFSKYDFSLVGIFGIVSEVRLELNLDFTVLNIGSHYGYPEYIYSTPGWSLQCAGKSAREIFLQCAFDEQRDKSPFELFTFVPGTVKTDMLAKSIEGLEIMNQKCHYISS